MIRGLSIFLLLATLAINAFAAATVTISWTDNTNDPAMTVYVVRSSASLATSPALWPILTVVESHSFTDSISQAVCYYVVQASNTITGELSGFATR